MSTVDSSSRDNCCCCKRDVGYLSVAFFFSVASFLTPWQATWSVSSYVLLFLDIVLINDKISGIFNYYFMNGQVGTQDLTPFIQVPSTYNATSFQVCLALTVIQLAVLLIALIMLPFQQFHMFKKGLIVVTFLLSLALWIIFYAYMALSGTIFISSVGLSVGAGNIPAAGPALQIVIFLVLGNYLLTDLLNYISQKNDSNHSGLGGMGAVNSSLVSLCFLIVSACTPWQQGSSQPYATRSSSIYFFLEQVLISSYSGLQTNGMGSLTGVQSDVLLSTFKYNATGFHFATAFTIIAIYFNFLGYMTQIASKTRMVVRNVANSFHGIALLCTILAWTIFAGLSYPTLSFSSSSIGGGTSSYINSLSAGFCFSIFSSLMLSATLYFSVNAKPFVITKELLDLHK
jgi:hypothetical protein